MQRLSAGSKNYVYKPNTNTPQTIGSWNYSADATGNITSAGSSSTTMTYDPFTELTMREVKGTRKQNYQYDGKKERVLKIDSNGTVVKTLYLQGLNDYPLMVINGSNEYMYVYGIGGMVAMRVNGTWFYAMRDHLGSTKLIINNTSSVVARYEYDPYGKYLDSMYINTGSSYQFTGQELDETGLYNFRARMYDTSAAIFYAADPAGQGYSRYGYCGGNPVIFIDPTGEEDEPDGNCQGQSITVYGEQSPDLTLSLELAIYRNAYDRYREVKGVRRVYDRHVRETPLPQRDIHELIPMMPISINMPDLSKDPVQNMPAIFDEDAMFEDDEVVDYMAELWTDSRIGKGTINVEVAFAIEFDPINNRYHPIRDSRSFGRGNSVHIQYLIQNYPNASQVHSHSPHLWGGGNDPLPSINPVVPLYGENGKTTSDYIVATEKGIPIYVFSDMGIWVVYPGDKHPHEIVSKKWLKKLELMR